MSERKLVFVGVCFVIGKEKKHVCHIDYDWKKHAIETTAEPVKSDPKSA